MIRPNRFTSIFFSKGWVTLKKPFRLISNTRLHSSCSIHSIRLSRRIPALFQYLNVGIGMLLHPAVQCGVCGYPSVVKFHQFAVRALFPYLLQGGFGFRIVALVVYQYMISHFGQFQTYSLSDAPASSCYYAYFIFLATFFLRYTIILSISLYLGVSSRNTGKNARISLYTCCDRGLSRSAISNSLQLVQYPSSG